MARTIHAGGRTRSRGFIVVVVLWMLGALATLAAIYAIYVADTAIALRMHDESVQAEAMVTAGVELAAHRMTATPNSRPTSGRFTFSAGDATAVVDFRSEAARIDLNAAPKELLAGLFAALGAQRSAAEFYADRIIGWRSVPRSQDKDNEASLYRTAGLLYGPRLGWFPHTGELALVLGLPEALIERALPFVTVYSAQAQVNVFDSAPEVIAALPSMTPERLHRVLVLRSAGRQNASELLTEIGQARALVTTEGSKAVRVAVRINFANGRTMTSEVVIVLRDGGTEPYSVLSWRGHLDGVAG
jgi:general secretion pathway protein K